MTRHRILAEARFDPKLRIYLFASGCLTLTATIIGIPLLPLWIPIGLWWSRRYFDSLSCALTERAVVVRRGVLFHREKTIPLDKIQDLSLRDGPLLRAFGLRTVRLETAGQSSPQGAAEADLVGLVDAMEFRDRVLDQRDRVVAYHDEGGDAHPSMPRDSGDVADLLRAIRDGLGRIEAQIDRATSQR